MFPRSKDRGLIEAPTTAASSTGMRWFPRSKDRGLIEATTSVACPARSPTFPRSKDRGLIEATRRKSFWTAESGGFRDRKIAASLKPVSRGVVSHAAYHVSAIERSRPHRSRYRSQVGKRRKWKFPRSKDRGLIEAARAGSCGRSRRTFPRSKDRGLIEATPAYRGYRSLPLVSAIEKSRPH